MHGPRQGLRPVLFKRNPMPARCHRLFSLQWHASKRCWSMLTARTVATQCAGFGASSRVLAFGARSRAVHRAVTQVRAASEAVPQRKGATAEHKGLTKRPPRRPWTADEDARLAEARAAGMPWREICGSWPQRTSRAVRQRASVLKLEAVFKHHHWHDADDAKLLRLKSKGTPWQLIAKEFPGRTVTGVRHRWHRLRDADVGAAESFKRNLPWELEDVSKLMELRREGLAWRDLGARLGRTPGSALAKYHEVHREKGVHGQLEWSAADLGKLKAMREQGLCWKQVAAAFPDRRPVGVRLRYHSFGKHPGRGPAHSRWSSLEDSILLKRLHAGRPLRQIREKDLPKRSLLAIAQRARKLLHGAPRKSSDD